jgi:hypothetical protein
MSRHPTTEYADEREPTPVGGTSISTEGIRALARDEAEAVGNEMQQECIKSGPICNVWKEIGSMRADIGVLKTEAAESRGAMKAQARNVTIVVAIIGALGLLAQVSNRIWPVQPAQASHPRQEPEWHRQAEVSAPPTPRPDWPANLPLSPKGGK